MTRLRHVFTPLLSTNASRADRHHSDLVQSWISGDKKHTGTFLRWEGEVPLKAGKARLDRPAE